ncbi:MAG: BON domain-containing protein [Burkholderiales bacterium]
MRSDSDIKRDVEQELRWDADIDPTDIGVSVKDAVIGLTGFVRSYSQKWQAERDAKRITGVAGLANDIQVRLRSGTERTDPELAREAALAVRMQLPYVFESIKVVAANGQIALEGTVEWNYQRQRADEAVRHITGVKGVNNMLQVKPKVSPSNVKHSIEAAFTRSAEIDANGVTVKTDSGNVFLEGKVRTWAEREEAERAAWLAPGVTNVQNRLFVRP